MSQTYQQGRHGSRVTPNGERRCTRCAAVWCKTENPRRKRCVCVCSWMSVNAPQRVCTMEPGAFTTPPTAQARAGAGVGGRSKGESTSCLCVFSAALLRCYWNIIQMSRLKGTVRICSVCRVVRCLPYGAFRTLGSSQQEMSHPPRGSPSPRRPPPSPGRRRSAISVSSPVLDASCMRTCML